MASRAQVNTSALILNTSTYSVEKSKNRSLASEYGAKIEDVVSIHDFHSILRAQAEFLLQNSGLAIQQLTHTFSQLQKSHKREADILSPSELMPSQPATLRVLFPYVPQYGYLKGLELERQMPLRMTFGIEHQIGDDEFHVGRTNLWVAKDYTAPVEAPVDGSLCVLKDTVAHSEVLSAQAVEEYFERSMRSRHAATFALQHALKHLG